MNLKGLWRSLGQAWGDPQVEVAAVSKGSYDPTTGGVTGTTSTSRYVRMRLRPFGQSELDNNTVQRGDVEGRMAAGDGETPPDIDDTVKAGGDTYQVVDVQTVTHGGETSGYVLVLRTV